MVVNGCGSHHNKDYGKDANKMFGAFVKSLTDTGHTLEHASFTFGGTELIKSNGMTDNAYVQDVISTVRKVLEYNKTVATEKIPDGILRELHDLLPHVVNY